MAVLRLALSAVIYASAISLAGVVVVAGAHTVVRAWTAQVAWTGAKPEAVTSSTGNDGSAQDRGAMSRRDPVHRPSNDRSALEPRSVGNAAGYAREVALGTSRRSNTAQRLGLFRNTEDEDDDDDRPRETYRTLCVRMCDGYYFPISFSASREKLGADAAACQNRCGSEARLFVHLNPGSGPEQMQDLSGKPYASLPTAFLYRTQYVAGCKCRPDPWEAESRERHRVYGLIADARKGKPAAQAELKALETARREAASKPGAPQTPRIWPPDEQPMALGNNPAPPPPARARTSDPDWAKRLFAAP